MKKSFVGEFFLFIFSFLIALGTVVAHYLIKQINPVVLLFYTFLFAFVVINLLDIKNIKQLKQEAIQHWALVVKVNMAVAVAWLLGFFALKYLSGATVNSLTYGFAPIAAFILTASTYDIKKKRIQDGVFCFIILIILTLIATRYYLLSQEKVEKYHLIIAIFFAAVGGLAAGFIAHYCKQLYKCGFSTLAVIKIRYFVLIIVSMIFLFSLHLHFALRLSVYLKIVLLSFFFILVPAYFAQKGIEKTTPVVATIIAALIPVLTFLVQLFTPHYRFSIIDFILMLALSVSICLSAIFS